MNRLIGPEVRSELVRTRRRGVLLAWLGLSAVFAVLVNTVMFSVVSDDPARAGSGPGVAFPTLAQLQGPDGLTAGLGAASSLLGLVTLSFWAVLTATDYSTGLIRLLVSAQPRRWRLLAAKAVALSLWTVVATTVSLVACLAAAPASASAAGVDTAAWGRTGASGVAGAWVNLLLCLLAWGVLGLVLATASKSAAVAVSVGAGWVLLVEGVVGAVLDDLADRLPGATLSALARGGTPEVSYGDALLAGTSYVVVTLALAIVVVRRRDVTD